MSNLSDYAETLHMRAGDQERVKALINNAILAAEIAQADDDDDEDTLLLLYA